MSTNDSENQKFSDIKTSFANESISLTFTLHSHSFGIALLEGQKTFVRDAPNFAEDSFKFLTASHTLALFNVDLQVFGKLTNSK